MKKLLSVLLSAIILLTCVSPALAVEPRWQLIGSVNVGLSFNSNGTKGYVNTSVIGPANETDIITTSIVVYQKNLLKWVEIADFGKTSVTNQNLHTRSVSFNTENGKTYKAVVEYSVTSGQIRESDTSEIQRTA